MGIDFIIARFCPVKDALGDYFLSMVKKRAKLDYLELFKQDHPDFNEETVFEEVDDTPNCTYRRQTTMAAIKDELVHLEEWNGVCAECGVNFTYDTGGCWGYIPYPIPELIEKLMIASVQTLADGEGNNRAAALLDSVKEYAPQSKTIQEWREHDLTELKQPLSHTWGGMLNRRKTVTTDQLLAYIFDRNMLEGDELDKVTVFLEFFQRSLRESIPAVVGSQDEATDIMPHLENTLSSFLQFIKACQIADELGEGIYIIP